MNNLGLVSYNKRFLYAAVGAPGSTHDAGLLKSASIYSDIINGLVIPGRKMALGNFGGVPLVTMGDSAFPQFSWLIGSGGGDAADGRQKYFDRGLCGAAMAHGIFETGSRVFC